MICSEYKPNFSHRSLALNFMGQPRFTRYNKNYQLIPTFNACSVTYNSQGAWYIVCHAPLELLVRSYRSTASFHL